MWPNFTQFTYYLKIKINRYKIDSHTVLHDDNFISETVLAEGSDAQFYWFINYNSIQLYFE